MAQWVECLGKDQEGGYWVQVLFMLRAPYDSKLLT